MMTRYVTVTLENAETGTAHEERVPWVDAEEMGLRLASFDDDPAEVRRMGAVEIALAAAPGTPYDWMIVSSSGCGA